MQAVLDSIRNGFIYTFNYLKRLITGLLETVASLLRSRKYLTILSGLLAIVLVAFIPRLAPYFDMIFVFILSAVLANIGGIAYEDAAKIARQTPPPDPATLPGKIIETLTDELAHDLVNPGGHDTKTETSVTAVIETETQHTAKTRPLPTDSLP